jgi:hypothetical protein
VENQRNLIWAVALTALLLLGWDLGTRYFFPQPAKPVASASASRRRPVRMRGPPSRRAKVACSTPPMSRWKSRTSSLRCLAAARRDRGAGRQGLDQPCRRCAG